MTLSEVDAVPTAALESWMFLGVRFDVLTRRDAPVAVAEMLLPLGASPPAHVHEGLDDSFYVLEGRMVVKCGGNVSVAGPGTWVQFPTGVPHTFRTVDGPVRALSVHADESFLSLVRAIGHPAGQGEVPAVDVGPSPSELVRILAEHDITVVGPPMEEAEAAMYVRTAVPAA